MLEAYYISHLLQVKENSCGWVMNLGAEFQIFLIFMAVAIVAFDSFQQIYSQQQRGTMDLIGSVGAKF